MNEALTWGAKFKVVPNNSVIKINNIQIKMDAKIPYIFFLI